jgi:hypothetical protein
VRKQQHKKKGEKKKKLGAHHPFVNSNDKKREQSLEQTPWPLLASTMKH